MWNFEPPCPYFFDKNAFLKRNPKDANDRAWVDDPNKDPFKEDATKKPEGTIYVYCIFSKF